MKRDFHKQEEFKNILNNDDTHTQKDPHRLSWIKRDFHK